MELGPGRWLLALLCSCGIAWGQVPPGPAAGKAAPVTSFSFVHASDTHAPDSRSTATIATIRHDAPIELTPFRTTAPAPEFAITTGDVTEFGGSAAGRAAFESNAAAWKSIGLPVWYTMGNHDATWDCLRSRLREVQGGANLAFEKHGVKFLLLDSSTPQDPRPSFSAEVITFVRDELAKTPLATPLVLAFHHPPDGTEFASPHDHRRLFDLLEGRPVLAILAGHGHTVWHRVIDGVDTVGGGSTFPKSGTNRGFNVVAVKDGTLRVAFAEFDKKGAFRPVLEKRIDGVLRNPLAIDAPRPDESFEREAITVRATVRTDAVSLDATAQISGRGEPVPLRVHAGRGEATLEGTLPITGVPAGEAVVVVTVKLGGEAVWIRTAAVLVAARDAALRRRFRVELPGSVRALRLFGDVLLVGCGDGTLHGLSPRDGHRVFAVRTGGEILSRPLVLGVRAYFASGDGKARAIDARGGVAWETDLGAPAYAEPVMVGGLVIFATNAGMLHALDPATGTVAWSLAAAKYAIEAAPATDGTRLVFGAWDELVHSYLPDGNEWSRGLRLEWAHPSAGAAVGAPGVRRYYSPADAAPAIVGDLVYVADRAYQLTVMNKRTGERLAQHKDVSAVVPARDGRHAVARGTDDTLRLVDRGEVTWSVRAETGVAPIPPVFVPGSDRILVLSNRGVVTLVAPHDDKPVAVRSVAAGSFTLATPEATSDAVFVGALDGSLTGLELPKE